MNGTDNFTVSSYEALVRFHPVVLPDSGNTHLDIARGPSPVPAYTIHIN
jgi:hypothetical protein